MYCINAYCVVAFMMIVVDIRDLICVDDVMEDDALKMGPNGGLIFCME